MDLPPNVEAICKLMRDQINAGAKTLLITAQQHRALREYTEARDAALFGRKPMPAKLRYLHHDVAFEPESEYCI